MLLTVNGFKRTARFDADVRKAPPDIVAAAETALKKLQENSRAGCLRMHPMQGLPKPMVFKLDVLANHSWQITFEMHHETAHLRRLATHKSIDRRPR